MQRFDVVILGGGLVGLTLGIALSGHGVRCAVIDPADPVETSAVGFYGRVSAISSTSHAMISAIGVTAFLDGKGCPIDRIWVSDGLEPGALDAVYVSAGRRGLQVSLAPADLIRLTGAVTAPIAAG